MASAPAASGKATAPAARGRTTPARLHSSIGEVLAPIDQRGGPMTGVHSGPAAPDEGDDRVAAGFVCTGVRFQLFVTQTLPDGSMLDTSIS